MTNGLAFIVFSGFVALIAVLVRVLYKILAAHREALKKAAAAEAELSLVAMRVDESVSRALIPANGREVFFPKVSLPNPVYEVTVSGILRKEDGRLGDAFCTTDRAGNFSDRAWWLRVNGVCLFNSANDILESDRCTHRYTVRMDGARERLALAISHASAWSGSLEAEVVALPEGTAGVRERRERDRAERRDLEAKRRTKRETGAAAERFAEEIRALCITSEAFRNWEDFEYRRKFAEAYCEELIENQRSIRAEALKFLSQHDIIRFLRRHHPEVISRFTGRLEALQLAEVISIERALQEATSLPAPLPEKRRLTTEEVRAIKIRKQQIRDQDRVALKIDKIETRLMVRDRLEKLPLDPDEREMLEQELIGEIEEGDGDATVRTI